MHLKTPCFLFATLIILFTIQIVLCQDEDGEVTVEKTCPQYLVDAAIQVLPKLFKCLFGKNRANLRFASFYEYLSRFWCILKCILVDMEILGLDGMLDETNALIVGQDMLPEWALPRFADKVSGCLKLIDDFKGNQYFCQSYIPFFQCAMTKGLEPGASFLADCVGPPVINGFLGVLRIFVPPSNEGGSGLGEGGEDRRRRRLQNPRNRTTFTIPLFNRFAAMLFSSQMDYELANIRAKGKRNNSTKVKKGYTKRQKPSKAQQEPGNGTAIVADLTSTTEKSNRASTRYKSNNTRALMSEIAANNNNLMANTQNIFSTAQSLVNAFWNVQRQFTGIGNNARTKLSVKNDSFTSSANINKYLLQKV